MAAFIVFGRVWNRFDCAPAPMIPGFALWPMMEGHIQCALPHSQGDAFVFVSEPISAGKPATATMALLAVILLPIRNTCAMTPADDEWLGQDLLPNCVIGPGHFVNTE